MKTYNDDNRLKISFKLNDELLQKQVKPRQLLSDFLRFDCGMTGTHVGCEHGICGACTILFNNEPVRSCLMLAPQIHDGEIITIEGISENSTYDDLREAFKKYHALQCGYCTPGFLTTIVYLLEKKQQNLQRYIKICKNTAKFAQICRDLLAPPSPTQGTPRHST